MAVGSFRKYFIPVWRSAPLLRLVLWLMLGIGLGDWLAAAVYQHRWWVAAGTAILLLLAALVRRQRLLSSLWLAGALVLAGMLLVAHRHTALYPHFAGRLYQPGVVVKAVLLEQPQAKEKSVKADARLYRWVAASRQWQSMAGNAILYFEKSASASQLQLGSQVLIKASLQPIKNAGNPGGFDYQRYAARQGLYFQAFLKDADYALLPGLQVHWLAQTLQQWHSSVLRLLQRYVHPTEASPVAQALLIGYRADLDKTLVEQYVATGVVHIIAISGMHLGMIYGVLLWLLRPLRGRPAMRWLRLLITLGIIWLFTLLTGAAPSISRAAVMFTVLALGQLYGRKVSIYNSLAGAALLLLLHNPFALWNVGFQLSFAAVLSIGVFYRPLMRSWQPRTWLLQQAWQLMAVTLAAQVLTLPLSIYHFHQFPVYFLLANVLAVPLSAVALYLLLALLAFGWWPAVAQWLGWLAGWSIVGLNKYIIWVSSLPRTTIGHIQIGWWQAALMFMLIACLAWWWLHRQPAMLPAALACLLVLLVARSWQYYDSSRQQRLIVYHVPRHTGIELVSGRRSLLVADSALLAPGFLQNFHLLPARIYYQFQPQRYLVLPPDSSNQWLQVGQRRILLLRQPPHYRRSQPVQASLVIVSGSLRADPYKVVALVRSPQWVLDGSCSRYQMGQWRQAADSLGLRLHAVSQQGAWTDELQAN